MARPENTKLRNAISKTARVIASDGTFNHAIAEIREVTGLAFAARREAEGNLPEDGGAKNWGWGNHVDAVDYWGNDALRNGGWKSDIEKSRTVGACYANAEQFLRRFNDWMAKHRLREIEIIVGAVLIDYSGSEFELWIDYIAAHARPAESFWITAAEHETLPADLKFRVRPDTEYVAVTGLNESGLNDLIEELRRRLGERRTQQTLIAAAKLAGNPFAREMPRALAPAPRERRGDLAGVIRGGRPTPPTIGWEFDDLVDRSLPDIEKCRKEWITYHITEESYSSEDTVRVWASKTFKDRLYQARKRARKRLPDAN
jgi:hypothetical protein